MQHGKTCSFGHLHRVNSLSARVFALPEGKIFFRAKVSMWQRKLFLSPNQASRPVSVGLRATQLMGVSTPGLTKMRVSEVVDRPIGIEAVSTI